MISLEKISLQFFKPFLDSIWTYISISFTFWLIYLFLAESKRYDQEYGAVFGGGMAGVSAALPRLRVGVNTGNFTEGRITVYGITNTGNV